MPTTTASPLLRRPEAPLRRSGFTLVELLLSTGLSAIVLAAVLSSVLFVSRSGYLLDSYSDMEAQARNALEQFGQDARMAENVIWEKSPDTGALVKLTLIINAGKSYTYVYNPETRELTRDGRPLISGVQTFTFTAYRYSYDTVADRPDFTAISASTDVDSIEEETKMVQISLSAIRSRNTLSDATNTVVSARFVLRNKDMT